MRVPCCYTAEIQREENKIKRSIKEAGKRGDVASAKLYAKEIVRSRKAVQRLETSKAQMNSVMMNVEMQVAQGAMIKRMNDTAGVMKMMNRLVKVEAVQQAMTQMQEEMTKAGVLEEMVDEAMDTLDDEADEDEADEEVQKVMTELAAEALDKASSAGKSKVSQVQEQDEEEEDMAAMRAKLEQIKAT